MLFSKEYGIKHTNQYDFFNPILIRDTRLFIDPFLIFKSNDILFKNSHDKLINFFNKAFELAARSGGNKDTNSYRKLLNILLFPEVSELCLGYTNEGIRGLGSGDIYRDNIIEGIYISIKKGLKNYKHFEEVAIFCEGIGCDRISDITANILKKEFIKYTQSICKKMRIKMQDFKIKHLEFDFEFLRWLDGNECLPSNPYSEKSIILVPKNFLNELPVISPKEFRDYIWTNKNAELRDDLNYEIKRSLNKSQIIKIAREYPSWVEEFAEKVEELSPNFYDLKNDQSGLYKWHKALRFAKNRPLELFANNDQEFVNVIEEIIQSFKLFVEDNSGYKLLWDDERERGKKEEAAQSLFFGVVKPYCMYNNIDISKETNMGKGPVDFKFSKGYKNRVLLEVKLARNSKFWNGLNRQLPQYLKSEEIYLGYFIVIVYTDEEFSEIQEIEEKVRELNQKIKFRIKPVIIDATKNKVSASNL
jgi:hypothetical protein